MNHHSSSTGLLFLLFVAAIATACTEAAEPGSRGAPPEAASEATADSQLPSSGDTTTPASSVEPAESGQASSNPTVERWRQKLPPGALVRHGACPFECCVYREWVAESRIALQPEPSQRTPAAAAVIEPGTAFQADSGFVQVTGLALIAVTESVTPMPQRTVEPGDTLVLLDYVGEGFYSAWFDGEVVEVSDFWSSATDRPRGEVIGEPQTEWWVHATAPGGEVGWFRADVPGVEIAGVDACGGPA